MLNASIDSAPEPDNGVNHAAQWQGDYAEAPMCRCCQGKEGANQNRHYGDCNAEPEFCDDNRPTGALYDTLHNHLARNAFGEARVLAGPI